MKVTYIFRQILDMGDKNMIKWVTDKPLRFQSRKDDLVPAIIHSHKTNEVVLSFHSSPKTFFFTEHRNEVYISLYKPESI
jgi:hypothetical protein